MRERHRREQESGDEEAALPGDQVHHPCRRQKYEQGPAPGEPDRSERQQEHRCARRHPSARRCKRGEQGEEFHDGERQRRIGPAVGPMGISPERLAQLRHVAFRFEQEVRFPRLSNSPAGCRFRKSRPTR